MSRAERIARTVRTRTGRRGPAIITGLILLLVLLGIAALAGFRAVTGRWPTRLKGLTEQVPGLTWQPAGVLVAESVLLVLGLILLYLALRPGKLRVAKIPAQQTQAAQHAEVSLSRRSLARLAAARADEVDGVDGLSSTATGRKVSLVVDTMAADAAAVGAAVQAAVSERLTETGIQPVPRVKVATRSRGGR